MSEIIKVSDTKVYIDGVQDKVIIMLHGWPDTHTIWNNQVAFFKKDFTCVTFTMPGFSKEDTQKYTLDEIILQIDTIVNTISPNKKVILILHDWGCLFGYEYAMRYADKIDRVIAIDIGNASSPEFEKSLSIKAKLMIFAYQITLALAWKAGKAIGDPVTKIMAKALQARSDMNEVHSGMDFPYAMRWLGINGGLKAVQSFIPEFPFFYTYGTKKPFFFHTQNWLNELQKNPANKVQAFDCGHWVMIDKKAEFNQAVKDWLIN